MKCITLFFLSLAVLVNCHHTFLGTNVNRTLLYKVEAKYHANLFSKRIEYLNYTIPALPSNRGRYIQGILAHDQTESGKYGATCNVTAGGLGYNYVNLRMKSERGKILHYRIYIYA